MEAHPRKPGPLERLVEPATKRPRVEVVPGRVAEHEVVVFCEVLAPRLVADHQRRGNTMLPGTVARDHAEDPPSVRAHLPMAHLDPIGDRRPLRKPFIRRRATFA